MRVAALYDVHGNLPALEAVLAEVPSDAAIVVGGDVVGGGDAAGAVERLRALGERARWLRGNAERELTDEVGEEARVFLHALPGRVELDVEGLGRVLFCHAVPQNDMDIVTPLTPDERLAQIVSDVDADLVVAGHTHVQHDRRVGGVRWVNAGSVGMPYENAPGAYWALLGPDVELRRTDYPGAEPPQASPQEASEYFESL